MYRTERSEVTYLRFVLNAIIRVENLYMPFALRVLISRKFKMEKGSGF